MKKLYKLISLIFLITSSLIAQKQDRILGTPCKDCYSQKFQPATIQNGNGTIATSYTNSACGLDFTQASVRLHKRGVSMTPSVGVNQPATITIGGIPPCATIVKAFLYSVTSGNGTTVTANVTNPAMTNSNFPMVIVGSDIDKCWGYVGTYTYRADLTSFITGNGNYVLNNLPVTIGANDTDGATLFIIYTDPSQNYTGSIVIADGTHVSQGAAIIDSITGFNVCGSVTLTNNFILMSDLQGISNQQIKLNSSVFNYSYPTTVQNMWDFMQAPGTSAVSGQTVATYGVNNSSDCFCVALAGMYYQTNCMSCAGSALTVNAVATSSTCSAGSATANVSGGTGPYTYTWNPTGSNAQSITGVTPGTYTVIAKDGSGCLAGTATVNIPSTTTVVCASQTICSGSSATLAATGATSYTWSTGAFTSNIIVSPLINTNYTVTGSNGTCTGLKVVSVNVNFTPVFSATSSSSIICPGQTVTLTASGASTYTYNPGFITGNPIAVSPTISTTYTITGSIGNGCNGYFQITQNVGTCTDVSQIPFSNSGITIYPNPNNGEFELSLFNSNESSSIEIYNCIGQLVKQESTKENNLKINISEQANGIYHLRVMRNGAQVYRTKLIKE